MTRRWTGCHRIRWRRSRGCWGVACLIRRRTLAQACEEFPRGGESGGPFYDLRHASLFAALRDMQAAALHIDLITVENFLRTRNLIEELGGITYLSGLQDKTPSAFNYPYYAAILNEKWSLRRMGRVLTEAARRIFEEAPEGERVAEFLNQIEAEVLGEGRAHGPNQVKPMLEVVRDCVDQIEHFQRGQGLLGGIATGLSYLDKMTGGLHAGELIVIGARPSVGKTSLAMNIAVNAAARGESVGVFTMEMSAIDVGLRAICGEARADFHQLRTGGASHRDLDKIAAVCPKIAKVPIYINEEPGLDIVQLRASARRMMHRYKIKLVVIDYLQLMKAREVRRTGGNRTEEIGAISGGCKAMAKELNIPVLVLSQLSRGKKGDRNSPELEDLREGGSIEQDADLVGLMSRDESEKDAPPLHEQPEQKIVLRIAKQRNGPLGKVELRFIRAQMRFEDWYGGTGSKAPRDQALDLALSSAPAPPEEMDELL